MGHRRYLPLSHRWKNDKKSFDGTTEKRHPPKMHSRIEILNQVQDLEGQLLTKDPKKRRKISHEKRKDNWNKKRHVQKVPLQRATLQMNVVQLRKADNSRLMEDLLSLSRGPTKYSTHCNGYIVNGYRFHVEDYDRSLRTQNCVIVVASKNDEDNEMFDYYGVLTDVMELQFVPDRRVILFRCNWFDMHVKIKGIKRDEYDYVSVNPSRFLKTNEPFVLVDQASQVFYSNDNSNKGWHLVRKTQPRDSYEVVKQMDDDVDDLESPSDAVDDLESPTQKKCKRADETENEDGSTIKSTMRYTFCVPGAIGKGRRRGLRSLITKGKTLTKNSLSSVYQPNDVVKQYIQDFETSAIGKGPAGVINSTMCSSQVTGMTIRKRFVVRENQFLPVNTSLPPSTNEVKPYLQEVETKRVEKKDWEWLVKEHFCSESFQGGKDGNSPDLGTIFYEIRKKGNKLVEPEAIEKHFKVVGLWYFGWSSILHQVTEKVMANKDTEFVVTNQIGSSGNENLGSNEEIQKLRQQMIEMHRAWANGLPPPPVPTDNLEYLSSLPSMIDSGATISNHFQCSFPHSPIQDYHILGSPAVHAFAAPPPPESPTFDVHPQVVPPYSTREPALDITRDQRYTFEPTFKLTGPYGDTHPPEFPPNTEKPVKTEEQEKMTKKLRSLELAMNNLQGLGGYKSVSYKDLCMFSGVNLPPGFKMPKFEKYDGHGDPVAHLRRYCNQLRASEWFVDQDIDRWNSWDDLANEFVQQFQYNVELIPDEKSLTSTKKKNTESFREYAIRWREQAARVKSPMKESKIVEVFIQAQDEIYYQHLLPALGKPFIEVLKMGEMIEEGINTGRIVSFEILKATTQAIQKGSGSVGEKKNEEDTSAIVG
ncbi:putative nitrate transporter 1.4-like [Capsicum annuum]|nr:putative nitrate transporter 1.4-like [Capsicum annuum]